MFQIFRLLWMYKITVLILMPWIVLFYTAHRMSDTSSAEMIAINYTVLLPDSREIQTNVIHLGIILNKKTASVRSMNLLKSILYHQDSITGILVQKYLRKANLYFIEYTFYNADPYLNKIKNYSHIQAFDHHEFLKMFWPEVIPRKIDKLITLDSNILVNYNIAELWDYFDRFTPTQALGIVFRPSDGVNCKPTQGERPHGISDIPDSAVVLWYLSRLRAVGWQRLAIAKVGALVEEAKHRNNCLEIFNEIVLMKRSLVYTLPCEWNLALQSSNATRVCPVVWPSARPDRVDCVSVGHKMGTQTKPNVVRLVQYRDIPDNEEFNNSESITAALDRTNISLTIKELRQRFSDISRIFQAVATECFGTKYEET